MTTTYDLSQSEGRRQFLEDYWLNLAGFAYGQFMQAGRGALLLSGSNIDESEMLYIVYNQLIHYPDIYKVVNDYEPELQIVAIFTLPGVLALQTYKGEPAPPEVYRFANRRSRH
jgi:hypothetical protein